MSIEPMRRMTENEYQSYLREGYLELSSQPLVRFGEKGKYVKLRKPMDCCERVGKIACCFFLCPFSAIFTALSCCICKYTYEPCTVNLLGEPIHGYVEQKGFIKNSEKTRTLYKEDFQALGCVSNNQEGMKQLVDSGQFPIMQSAKYPPHTYMTFYGPVSKFSYIILIPFGNVKNKLIFRTGYNGKSGVRLNTEALNKQAEIVCGGYHPDVGKITTSTTRLLVGSSVHDSPYGTITGKIYSHEPVIIS
ncbi:MAG: hypothetical protein K940chlam6_00377 [Chlamydiae bacterium]|nr:hypothetical protein [Chlamydiota bacterium]